MNINTIMRNLLTCSRYHSSKVRISVKDLRLLISDLAFEKTQNTDTQQKCVHKEVIQPTKIPLA